MFSTEQPGSANDAAVQGTTSTDATTQQGRGTSTGGGAAPPSTRQLVLERDKLKRRVSELAENQKVSDKAKRDLGAENTRLQRKIAEQDTKNAQLTRRSTRAAEDLAFVRRGLNRKEGECKDLARFLAVAEKRLKLFKERDEWGGGSSGSDSRVIVVSAGGGLIDAEQMWKNCGKCSTRFPVSPDFVRDLGSRLRTPHAQIGAQPCEIFFPRSGSPVQHNIIAISPVKQIYLQANCENPAK